MNPDTHPLTARIRPGEVTRLPDYERAGGYSALRRVLRDMEPGAVRHQVIEARLSGRGGAGFSTGLKWSFVPEKDDSGPHYLVCNCDEMEPGTFKDRLLVEHDPHQLLEGMALAAYTIGAETAYIFIRGEYHRGIEALRTAIAEAREAGLLGRHVCGAAFSLEIHLHPSAGRYICGEETALISALEGKRAVPRAKPPYPQVSGLWGRPTVINNVETLCNVSHILRNGADWFRGLSRSGKHGGTKLYGASGRVKSPGAWEMPFGVTAREIIEGQAGGMRDGYRLRGFLPGGASTDFLTDAHLDVPMTFEDIAQAGSRLGTGTMILLDDQISVVGMVRNLEHFFAQESCGWCTPCRDGLPWIESILTDLLERRGRPEDLKILEEYCVKLGPGMTFCAHAPGAVEPLQSALKHFRADFEALVPERDLITAQPSAPARQSHPPQAPAGAGT